MSEIGRAAVWRIPAAIIDSSGLIFNDWNNSARHDCHRSFPTVFPTAGFQIINENELNQGSSMPRKRLVIE